MKHSKQKAKKGQESKIEGRGPLQLAILFKPYFIVFVASTCGLVIEIVAARILAPSIGVSLYTWTSIIGIVLLGISIGNYVGGKLADRFPSPTTLGLILLVSGIFSLLILPLVKVLPDALVSLSLIPRIVLLTFLLFFIPSLILGMVSPVVIKLRLRDLTHTGNVVGKIYAVSTAGGIFGTFITGFVLIQWIGTRSIILVIALILIAMAIAFGNLWKIKASSISCLAIFLIIGGISVSNGALASNCLRESNYFCIRVEDTVNEGQPLKALYLDALVHGEINLEDPTFIGDYDKMFADLATYAAQDNPNFRTLIIGGGAYTFPRYLETIYPQSTVEVIEIDPEVTQVAFDYLGLSTDTSVITYNEDARMVVPKLPVGQYDIVIGDAFNDLSVPYHLTTREFNDQIYSLLNDDGIYATHVIDKLQSGGFLRAYTNTLQQTFPYVYIMRDKGEWEMENNDIRTLYVVTASLKPLSYEILSDANAQAGRGSPVSFFMTEDIYTSWLNAKEKILLTDDYAPVDNLLAPLHLEKHHLTKAEEYSDTGVVLAGEGKLEEAIAQYDEALRLDPYLVPTYTNRGIAYSKLGLTERAIQDFDQALLLDPQYSQAYHSRGAAYLNLGQFENAIQDFNEALRMDSQYVQTYINRGIAQTWLGQFESAIPDFDEAIRMDPNNPQTYSVRSLAHSMLNMEAEAQQDFDSAVRLGYDPALLQEELAKLKELLQSQL